jgi:hypothetical protein
MLVSNLTKTFPCGSRVMHELIASCYEAQERFRSAAANSQDHTMRRLLEIYAQQRTRFAEELREHLPSMDGENGEIPVDLPWAESTGQDSLRNCLDSDSRTLQLYRRALASRALPTRTHFLIASQLALLERAHERVSSLAQGPVATVRTVVASQGRIRA